MVCPKLVCPGRLGADSTHCTGSAMLHQSPSACGQGRTLAPHHQRSLVVTCNGMSGRGRGRSSDFGSSGDGLLLGGRGSSLQPGNPLLQPSGNPSNKPPPKLVLPGRGGPPPSTGGRLVIPDKGMEKMLSEGAQALGPEVVTMTGPNRYRPPAGFMNDTPQEDTEVSRMSPDEMINKLRARAGRWHQLAKLLPPLQQAGYDSSTVDEMTGITPALQNRWAVAATVYDSLVASNKLRAEQLSAFDQRGEDLLYPFRFLNQDMRVEAAEYILDKGLDAPACEVLARAMKEWERRPTERHGFTNQPGDCMAFKYLRDALECRKLEDSEVKMDQAMAAAVTDGARNRLAEVLNALRGESPDNSASQAGATGLASLTILRLDPDELGFRPIPLLGDLGKVTAGEAETAPRTTQEGAFGAFAIEGQAAVSCKWVALPQWKALAMMRHPVALAITDCAAVSAIVSGTKAKTEEDRRRLSGPGLVLADLCSTSGEDLDPASFYLVPDAAVSTARLSLLEGSQAQARGLTAVASVVFVARPPVREQATNAADSLLQL